MSLTKKVLISVVLVGLVSMAAGYGTMAFLFDQETAEQNTITTTIDVELGEQEVPFIEVEAKPSQRREVGPITIHNNGTQAALADISLMNVDDFGGANPEPEQAAEADIGHAVDNVSDVLYVDLSVDYDRDGEVDQVLIPDETRTLGQLRDQQLELPRTMNASERWDLYFSFHLKAEADDEYQGDVSRFDLACDLHQAEDGTDHTKLPLRTVVRLPDGFQEWTFDGRGDANLASLGSLQPTRGTLMGFISTGLGVGPGQGNPVDVSGFPGVPPEAVEGSTMHRNLTVPTGTSEMAVDYSFLTDDTTQNDGVVGAVVHENGTVTTFARADVSDANRSGTGGYRSQTGWRTANTTVVPGEDVEIHFTVYDANDQRVDSGATIDNVRFR